MNFNSLSPIVPTSQVPQKAPLQTTIQTASIPVDSSQFDNLPLIIRQSGRQLEFRPTVFSMPLNISHITDFDELLAALKVIFSKMQDLMPSDQKRKL